MPRIKVCGLTRAEDVELAVNLGADFLGFVLAPSPRSVEVSQLEALVAPVPASVLTVGVVVNAQREQVDRLLEVVDRVQFHGHETPDFCARYGRRGIKAFRIRAVEDLNSLEAYAQTVGAFLLDSFKEGVAGGTGQTFPWGYLRERSFSRPIFLAGGLNSSNLRQAVQLPQLEGVDVSSGLEKAPGVKDADLMKQFFAVVRE